MNPSTHSSKNHDQCPIEHLDPSTGLTCISCRLVFFDAIVQRAHYQEDWHRYNIKRRIAGFSPVRKEQFEKIAECESLARAEKPKRGLKVSEGTALYCAHCRKAFHSEHSYENHLQSKRHEEVSSRISEKRDGVEVEMKAQVTEEVNKCDEIKENHEQMDNANEYDENEAIPLFHCLFCYVRPVTTTYPSIDSLMEHMLYSHGFQLPDKAFCCDLEGLLSYLGQKIGCGRMCIRCGQRNFRDVPAVQKHMQAKNHCCFSLDGETGEEANLLVEFMDFYDYSPLYEEDEDIDDDVSTTETTLLFSDGAFLTLPSGARVGHRSLRQYFRQHLPETPMHQRRITRPGRSIAEVFPHRYTGLNRSIAVVAQHGGASSSLQVMGSSEASRRRAKDVAFMQKKFHQLNLRRGIVQNKLFKSRGRDDQQ